MKKKPVFLLICALVLCGVIAALIVALPRARGAHAFGPVLSLAAADADGVVSAFGGAPAGVAAIEDGAYLVTDRALHVLWRVEKDSAVIIAGDPGAPTASGGFSGGYADGAARDALFCAPADILAYRGGYVISDAQNHVLRFFDPQAQTVITLAGTGESGFTDGDLERAQFNTPGGLCLDEDGNLYIADAGNNAIRKMDATGYVSTFLGANGAGFTDGSFDIAKLDCPTDVAFSDGVFYIADLNNRAIRIVETGSLKTLAGTGEARVLDGALSVAAFAAPTSIAVREGQVYVADYGGAALRKIEQETVTTLVRGTAQDTLLCAPTALYPEGDALVCADALAGRLYTVRA